MILAWTLLASTDSSAEATFSFADSAAIAAVIAAVGSLVVVLVQTFGKKPADRQAEVEFGVKILQEQVSKAERDQDRWLKVEEFLRERLQKAEAKDAEQRGEILTLNDLLSDARAQIQELSTELTQLRSRTAALAAKYTRGDDIELADIIGHEAADAYPDVRS